ncbi:MAG: PQQ-dependent sugar dehydrogenase [Caldilineales bacterium]|nr:PQQ-dependent sugar dehydrogenase [Caldilineales bacterium]
MKAFLFALLLTIGLAAIAPFAAAQQDEDWRQDWAVADGFALAIDTEGFHFPTAIAFVPQPGPDPDDPLFFVAELYGTIKVVTNDRSVYTFAEDLGQVYRQAPPPDVRGELGLSGLCLDAEHGYVFAGFVGYDDGGVLRNHLLRFETRPQTFDLAPRSYMVIADLMADHPTSFNHAIGGCAVDDQVLYVGVGDAFDPDLAASTDSISGKVLRMTLDGQPLPDNPSAIDDDPRKAENYVWSSGYRNPFSVAVADHQVYIADNGLVGDRFVRPEAGSQYLWDGTEESFAVNADYLFLDTVSPTQMTAITTGKPFLPADLGTGFVMGSAAYGAELHPGLIFLPYDFSRGLVAGVHRSLVELTSSDRERVVAAAVGPDGLYFAPFVGDPEHGSPILRLEYNPAASHPYWIDESPDGRTLLESNGCTHCHTWGDHVSTTGPSLNQPELSARVKARLDAPGYAALVAELDARTDEPFVSFRKARQEIMAAQGDDKVRLWLANRLLEPKFDNPSAQMPNLNLTAEEAKTLAEFLTPPQTPTTLVYDAIKIFVPELRYRHVALAFGTGFVTAIVLLVLVWLGVRFIITRKRGRAA